MKKDVTSNFTEGPILSSLVRFALPLLAALLLQSLYGAVDLFIVGHFGNETSVVGVGTGSAIMLFVNTVINGLTTGVTVVLSRYIGAGRPEKAGRTIGGAIGLFALVAALLTAVMLAGSAWFVRLMQTPEAAFDKTLQYVRICSCGIVCIVAYNVLSGIFRGMGNSRLPLLFVGIACAANIGGDLLLCGPLHMDVRGAAIATVFAQGLSVALSLLVIRRQRFPFSFSRRSIGFPREEIRGILRIGLPLSLQDALISLSFLILNGIVNSLGLMQSAGYSISEKVTNLVMLVPSAIGSGMAAFVAQNIGAGKHARAREALFSAMKAASAVGAVMFLLTYFGGGWLSSLFSREPEVIARSAEFLRGFSPDCLLTCILFSFNGYFSGCGRTRAVMIQGIAASLLVRVPLAWLFAFASGGSLVLIGLATPVSSVCSILYYILGFRRLDRLPA